MNHISEDPLSLKLLQTSLKLSKLQKKINGI